MQHNKLNKVLTGIRGLDDITNGGFPRGRATLLAGGPGSGKTVLALQALVNGAKNGEPGIFVAFEEDSVRIVANAATFGWNLPELENQSLFFLDAKPRPDVVCAGQFDLAGLLASLKAKADKMGAKRIVFDSIDVLLSLLNDSLAERRELYRLGDWLVESGLTGIITCKNNDSGQTNLDYQDFMQYMVDCAIFLRHDLENRVARRTLRIVKYRGSGFYAGEVALTLGDRGVEVVSFPQILSRENAISTERVSSGVERLDSMLGGGYYRGAAVLLSGAPGTAKTTLCGSFLLAACERGERALFVGFDEPAQEIVRNLLSVGIDLEPHIASGLLQVKAIRSSLTGAEEHIGSLHNILQAHQPRCFVIDPLSAIISSDADASRRNMPEQLLEMTKSTGVTMVCSSLLDSNDSMDESSDIQASAVADTWIHLSYEVHGGERNRALSIIKSRGTEHSNQVRELILSSNGITLADVYQSDGMVLMGTARRQKEIAEKDAEELLLAGVQHKRQELELAQAEVNARIEVLQREMAVKRSELEMLLATEVSRLKIASRTHNALWGKRSGDIQKPSSA